jgi:hypothetical protein
MPVIEDLEGLRVLVVEDDSLICLLLEDMLSELGCKVIGTACNFQRATELARRDESIDLAILDVNLGGQLVFSTGLGAGGLPEDWQGHSYVQKPMTVATLATALGRAIRDRVPR